jgi:hypothetical protein
MNERGLNFECCMERKRERGFINLNNTPERVRARPSCSAFARILKRCILYNACCQVPYTLFQNSVCQIGTNDINPEEWCLLGCYAVWLL